MNQYRLNKECAKAVALGQFPPSDVVWHLVRMYAEHITSGKDLVKCLGAGGAHRRFKRDIRDEYLFQAFGRLTDEYTEIYRNRPKELFPSEHKRAAELLKRAEEFRKKTTAWRKKFPTNAPPDLSPCERFLFLALNTHEPIPKSAANLQTALSFVRAQIQRESDQKRKMV